VLGIFSSLAVKLPVAAANLVGARPMPPIARFGRLAYPMRGEVTNRAVLGRKLHGCPGTGSGSQRWERPGWQQTQRPEGCSRESALRAEVVSPIKIRTPRKTVIPPLRPPNVPRLPKQSHRHLDDGTPAHSFVTLLAELALSCETPAVHQALAAKLRGGAPRQSHC
jgi:hypothetical protein